MFNAVLDNGKSESCSADLLAVAFVNSVKSLEYTALVILADADAGILDNQSCLSVYGRNGYRDFSVFFIILDCVVCKIIDDFA